MPIAQDCTTILPLNCSSCRFPFFAKSQSGSTEDPRSKQRAISSSVLPQGVVSKREIILSLKKLKSSLISCCAFAHDLVQWGPVRIRHSIRDFATQPVIFWILLGGKPKWLPLNFGFNDVMRTAPIHRLSDLLLR